MAENDEKELAYYESWIEKNYPTHDRTSCNDTDMYNAGTVTLRHRCERCESLSQLRYWKLSRNAKL